MSFACRFYFCQSEFRFCFVTVSSHFYVDVQGSSPYFPSVFKSYRHLVNVISVNSLISTERLFNQAFEQIHNFTE